MLPLKAIRHMSGFRLTIRNPRTIIDILHEKVFTDLSFIIRVLDFEYSLKIIHVDEGVQVTTACFTTVFDQILLQWHGEDLFQLA